MDGKAIASDPTQEPPDLDLSPTDHFTGVIIIHGIGDEKRNETLQEALGAIAYWFNHIAGLAWRPRGPGRVWLTTRLVDDENPEAPCSRALLELEAPSALAAAEQDDSVLRIEFREVWWAESFGLPSLGSALKWAQVQFREEATRVLLPLSRGVSSSRAGASGDAASTMQEARSLSYPHHLATVQTSQQIQGEPSQGFKLSFTERIKRVLLSAYAAVQYIWKLTQWVVLLPVIYVVLWLVTIARLLSRLLKFIPLIQGSVLDGLTDVVNYISLHWIAPLQVYMTDYSRSTSIRQRFDRELKYFLQNELCDRIIVSAHSMGTVIAYEGLTTSLSRIRDEGSHKPITFVCLGQALRRMWLLEGTDPHRLRNVLPEQVQWLNFWSRYDPVAAGPLDADALPRALLWTDAEEPDPYSEICATLKRCKNFPVTNADSLLADHTTYWQNLDEVVGPFARELVIGHPALRQVVETHLASAVQVLDRRWGIAWRATLALGVGLAAFAAVVLIDQAQGWLWGTSIDALVIAHGRGILDALLALLLPSVCSNGVSCSSIAIQGIGIFLSTATSAGAAPAVPPLPAGPFTSIVLATAVMGVMLPFVGWLVEKRSPFTFRTFAPASRRARLGAFVFASLALGLLLVSSASFVVLDYPIFGQLAGVLIPLYEWTFSLGQLVGAIALVLSLFDLAQRRWWIWFTMLLLVTALVTPTNPFHLPIPIASFLLVFIIAISGCVLVLGDLARGKRWGWFASVLLTTLAFLYMSLFPVARSVVHSPIGSEAVTLATSRVILAGSRIIYIGPLVPTFIYGLWSGPAQLRRQRGNHSVLHGQLLLAMLYLALFTPAAVIFIPPSTLQWGQAGVAIIAWVVAVISAVRTRRWGWLITLTLLAGLSLMSMLDSLGLLAAVLAYSFWVGRGPADDTGNNLRSVSSALTPVEALASLNTDHEGQG